MTITKIPLCGLLLVFILGLVGAGMWAHRQSLLATHDVAVARAATEATLKLAESSLAKADTATQRGAVLRRQRDSALAAADTHAHRADQLTGKLAALVATAPDTCRTIIITADSALAEKDSVIGELHGALDHSIRAESLAVATSDTLRAALVHVRDASTALVHATKKEARIDFFKKILPHPGFGIVGGLDRNGSPHAVAGLTLGWSF